MSRPKLKEKDRRKNLSISLDPKLINLLKKNIANISKFVERLIVEELSK
jgi:post-segregation antitoxin (ccd killing protein)